MPDFMYRFRPVDRLLGDAEKEGELQGLYIYFASPEQLNDPLEGRRDLYWCGDEVVWKNLLKHYLYCLVQRASQYLDGEIRPDNFPKRTCWGQAGDSFKKILDRIYLNFIANEAVADHISILAGSRPIRRDELIIHLGTLHNFALITVGAEFEKEGWLNQNWLSGIPDVDFLGGSKALVRMFSLLASEDDRTELLGLSSEVANDSLSAHNLARQYKVWEARPHDIGWYSLTSGFSEDFCNSLEYLSFPDWYVACFMEDCTDASIWGSYGQNHKAVCLKFKTESIREDVGIDLYHQISDGTSGPGYGFTRMKLEKVNYDKPYTSVDFFRSFGKHPIPILYQSWYVDETGRLSECGEHLAGEADEWRDKYWEIFYDGVTTKLSDWHGEKEYRIVLHSNLFDLSPAEKRKLKYKFDSLEGIIFGIATPDIDKMKIISAIEALCRENKRKDFSFYQAFYNSKTQRIDIRKLSATFFTIE